MNIRISKESDVTIRQQLAEQIVFLIATGKLKAGDTMPSVRSLATRLKIHHNTVSKAYRDLVAEDWLVWRPGSRMAVRSPGEWSRASHVQDLDDLINATIQAAREHGYTLQQLRQRVQERLMLQPPDHFLLVSKETGMRYLLWEELKDKLSFPVEACSLEELASNRELAAGALVVTAPGVIQEVMPLVPKDRPAIPLTFSGAEEHLELIRKLREPSVIAVVSVSERFLITAKGLLSPVVGQRHTLQEYLMPLKGSTTLGAADVVFCDSIAHVELKSKNWSIIGWFQPHA